MDSKIIEILNKIISFDRINYIKRGEIYGL